MDLKGVRDAYLKLGGNDDLCCKGALVIRGNQIHAEDSIVISFQGKLQKKRR